MTLIDRRLEEREKVSDIFLSDFGEESSIGIDEAMARKFLLRQ